MCTARLFSQGSISLHSNFTWTGSSPINHQKTKDTGLHDGEDGISLISLVLTQYRSVTDGRTDGQTDGRICRIIYSSCKIAALCKKQTADTTVGAYIMKVGRIKLEIREVTSQSD